jgi:hypothetical protein
MRAIIFAGPTLPPAVRPVSGPAIEWRPPVRQGDVYRAALSGPSVIGIVDGYFEVVPTVWHKEILWAMTQGIHVFGAASTGALRAAELDAFGMRGIGRIYEAFRDGVLEDDDEVALLHGPEEVGYPALTEAMINIRATISEAERGDILAPELAAQLTGVAKSLFYKERTYDGVLKRAAVSGFPSAPLREFAGFLASGRIDQKRRDAESLFAVIRAHITEGLPPLRVRYELADTVAWQAARRRVEPAIG